MSSAYYPLGMNSMPASGYNHKSTYYNKQYIPWKGTGVNSFPVGTAPGHIRPLTNNDTGNVFQSGSFPSRTYAHTRVFIPRPIKHFRKGRVIPANPITDVPNLIGKDPHNKNISLDINENALINYNMNRFVKSTTSIPLGGSSSSSGLLNDMLGAPGSYLVKQNPAYETDNVSQLNADCKTCEGIGIVASYKPNTTFLEENPEPTTQNPTLCCNDEYKAKRRAIYASTNLNKNYYTTTKQYLQNRCKTYEQKAFNFLSYRTNLTNGIYDNNPYYISVNGNKGATPGSPLALANTYLANCQLNSQLYEGSENAFIYKLLNIMLNEGIITQTEITQFNSTGINSIQGFFNWIQGLPESQKVPAANIFVQFIRNPYWGMPPSGPSNPTGCQLTVYKPNNYQYAKQGAVDSSTRNLKLNVDTISTNAASIQNYNNTGPQLVSANQLYAGVPPNIANLYKNKAPTCNTPWPLNFSQSGQFQNKKFCHYKKQLPQYNVPLSQPSPYRYYPTGNVFNSNHFSQSPNTYNTTSRSVSI
jgi:hypothetical protein